MVRNRPQKCKRLRRHIFFLYHTLLYCIFLLFFLIVPSSKIVWAGPTTNNPWTHSFYFENDLFTGTDNNYTNGVKYSLITPDLSPDCKEWGKIPKKILSHIHNLPFIKNTPPETVHKVEFSIGQNMFTPADISRSDLIIDDRPYAGWTYIGTSYHKKGKLANRLFLMDTVEIQLGIIGPDSLAEESQTFVHDTRHLQLPNGWGHQLSNEPGVVLAFERKWLFRPRSSALFGYNAVAHTGFSLGNVATYVNTGLEIRFGVNIPSDFGVSLIRPAGSTRMATDHRPALYLLGGVNGRLVLRDIFLDGNSFTGSHSVGKESLVGDFAAGVAFNYGNFMVTFTQILRTKQFSIQNDHHSFGAVSLSWFFSL